MNPHCISHRLFAAALSQLPPGSGAPALRETEADRRKTRTRRDAPAAEVVGKKGAGWSWSGWQHTTL